MAEEMEVDMTFSDVMDVDISMADADISKLLNGTLVVQPSVLQVPRPHAPAGENAGIAAQLLPAVGVKPAGPTRTTQLHAKKFNSTFNTDNVSAGAEQDGLDASPIRCNKVELNSTFRVDDIPRPTPTKGDTNGNAYHNNRITTGATNLDATPQLSRETNGNAMNSAHNATNGSVSHVANLLNTTNTLSASKTSDYSSGEVTVLEITQNTTTLNASAGIEVTQDINAVDAVDLLNVTHVIKSSHVETGIGEIEVGVTDKAPNVVEDPALQVAQAGCTTSDNEKTCILLSIAQGSDAAAQAADMLEKMSEKSDDDFFEDALPPEEEVRQVLDGRRVSLSRHSVEINLDAQIPDILDERELEELAESLGQSEQQEEVGFQVQNEQHVRHTDGEAEDSGSTHSSGNYHDVHDGLDSAVGGSASVSDDILAETEQAAKQQDGGNHNIQSFFTSLVLKKSRNSTGPLAREGCDEATVSGPQLSENSPVDLLKAESTTVAEQLALKEENLTCKATEYTSEQLEVEAANSTVILEETLIGDQIVSNKSGDNSTSVSCGLGVEPVELAVSQIQQTKSTGSLLRPNEATGKEMDQSVLLMLDESVSSLQTEFGSLVETVPKEASSNNLLDCTLDGYSVFTLQQQQFDLKKLQASNRFQEKVPIMKDTHASLPDNSMLNIVENKENIENATGGLQLVNGNSEPLAGRPERRDKPRPSLLLQFDPLANLNNSIKEDRIEASPVKTVTLPAAPAVWQSPRALGRLIDIDQDLEQKKIMDAVNEENMNLLQEVSRLKLELIQVKQENTSLTLEIQKKEELYLKAEANSQLREGQYKVEVKQLLEQLESVKEQNNNEELSDMKKELKHFEMENKRLLEETAHYKKILNEYESTLSAKNCENEKLKTEHATVTQHLAALEVSFSDTITKYDRCKEIVAGFTRNEDTLQDRLEKSNRIAVKYEERYETLKSHANSQLDRANKDLIAAKDAHKAELAKLNTMNKRLEINIASLQQRLEQKTAECTALATLCDEMTGSA